MCILEPPYGHIYCLCLRMSPRDILSAYFFSGNQQIVSRAAVIIEPSYHGNFHCFRSPLLFRRTLSYDHGIHSNIDLTIVIKSHDEATAKSKTLTYLSNLRVYPHKEQRSSLVLIPGTACANGA
jgi:hypothetical protein